MQRNQTRRNFLRLPSSGSPASTPNRYTANETFFRQQLRHVPPVDPTYWALTIGGLLQRPLVLNHQAFHDRPSTAVDAAVACVGSTAAQPIIGHACWRGVPLQLLLDEVVPRDNATYAQFFSADGYTTFIETERLTDAILAYEMNGVPLPPEHGFPVRLVVPGLYGYKMPKWVQRIQLTDTPTKGFWEERGWSAAGIAQTLSGILTPRHLETVSGTVTFSGFAYAGERAVTQIELSVDDAPWMPVAFTPKTPSSWVTWSIEWTPPAPGDYLIKVRAADSSGFIQPDAAPAFPDGSSAVQRIVIRVTV